MYVHGEDLIRARDVNLPPPVNVSYPVYDASGTNFLGTYYDVDSFSTWQSTQIADLPVSALHQSAGASDSAARVDQCFRERGLERLSRRHALHSPPHDQRRLLHAGLHLRARHRRRTGRAGRRASRDGAEFLRAQFGEGPQRHRPAAALRLLLRSARPSLFIAITSGWERFFNDWKASGVFTYGSGRPVSATVTGDANQDGNNSNDRLPGSFAATRFSGPTTPPPTCASPAVFMPATASSWN